MDLTNPLVYGVPAFVAFILLELAYSKGFHNKGLYVWKDLAASSAMGLGSVVLAPVLKVISAGVIFEAVYHVFNYEDANGDYQNILGYASFGYAWYIWLICQFLDDFSYYWFHRANHTVRIFWAAHIVHHSSDNFNYGTGIRNGWFTIMYKPLFYMWLPAIGFPPPMVIFCLGIEALWQFQLHTKYVPKLGFLEKFLNTHTQHQVHHARNVEYLDKNHGGYLNMFDKIFGSFQELEEDKIDTEYGVLHPPDSYNPLVILTHEYGHIWQDVRGSKSIKEVFMYIFGPPGWSPDGSRKTVKQMQRELEQERQQAAAKGQTVEQSAAPEPEPVA